MDRVSENFLFNQEKSTEINSDFLSKIISENNIFENSELNSLNNLIRLIQNKLDIVNDKNVKKFKMKNSKMDFINILFQLCLKKKMNAYIFQTVNEDEYMNSDKKNRGIVIGKENKYNELTIGIPNILANIWASEQASMIILDDQAKIYKKIGFYLEYLGYNLYLVDIYDFLGNNINKTNLLEQLYKHSLLLIILKDFQKQFLYYKLFLDTEYDGKNDVVKINSKTYDFSVGKHVPQLSKNEYLDLKEKYPKIKYDMQNFIYDDSIISDNRDYKENKNFYLPSLKSKDDLKNPNLFCGLHNIKFYKCECYKDEPFLNDKYLLINEIILSNEKNLNEYIINMDKEKEKIINDVWEKLSLNIREDSSDLKDLFVSLIKQMCLFLELKPNKFNLNNFNFKLFKKIFIHKYQEIKAVYDKNKRVMELINNGLMITSQVDNTSEKLYYFLKKINKKYNFKIKEYDKNIFNNLELVINKYIGKEELVDLHITKKINLNNSKPKVIFLVLPNNSLNYDDELLVLFMEWFFKEINLISEKWLLISNNNSSFFLDIFFDKCESYLIDKKIKTLFLLNSLSLLQENIYNFFNDSKLKIFIDVNDNDADYLSKELGEKKSQKELSFNTPMAKPKIKTRPLLLTPSEIKYIYTERDPYIIVLNNKTRIILNSPLFNLSENNKNIKNNLDEYFDEMNLDEYFDEINNEIKVIENYNEEYFKNKPFIVSDNYYLWNKENLNQLVNDDDYWYHDLMFNNIEKIINNKYSLNTITNDLKNQSDKNNFEELYSVTKEIIKFELTRWQNTFFLNYRNNLEKIFNALLINQIFSLIDNRIIFILESLIQKNFELDFNFQMFEKNDFYLFIEERIKNDINNNLKLLNPNCEEKLKKLIMQIQNSETLTKNLQKCFSEVKNNTLEE